MDIENAQKFLINSGKSHLAKILFYDTETRTSTELMATLLEGYHQSEVLKLNINSVSISLLKKYMAHVMDNESVSFVENANDSLSKVKFTDNELETLKSINKEITNEY